MKMSADESGIITRNQIKSKVDELLGSKEFGTRVSILKEMARKSINKGGCFFENLSTFVDAMHERVKSCITYISSCTSEMLER